MAGAIGGSGCANSASWGTASRATGRSATCGTRSACSRSGATSRTRIRQLGFAGVQLLLLTLFQCVDVKGLQTAKPYRLLGGQGRDGILAVQGFHFVVLRHHKRGELFATGHKCLALIDDGLTVLIVGGRPGVVVGGHAPIKVILRIQRHAWRLCPALVVRELFGDGRGLVGEVVAKIVHDALERQIATRELLGRIAVFWFTGEPLAADFPVRAYCAVESDRNILVGHNVKAGVGDRARNMARLWHRSR